MSFFDQKQEVMDVKLTQFGKNLMARGFFKPVYYQFFDDDILYNGSCAGIVEEQSEAEVRILKNTPRLKTIHLSHPVEMRYYQDDKLIKENKKDRFAQIKRTVIPEVQEKILLYPLSNQEVKSQKAPTFDIRSLSAPIISISSSALESAGVQKNVPILKIEPEYILQEDRGSVVAPEQASVYNGEEFNDLLSSEITFLDNSKLKILPQHIVLNMEEIGGFDGQENFYLNIYKVDKQDGETKAISKLDSIEKAKKYFSIKIDTEVDVEEYSTPESKNYYKRGEI